MQRIAGFVTNIAGEEAILRLGRMLQTLRHEPGDVIRTWIEGSLGLYIGWVARKDSFADGMPLRNERGDVVLFFSGEEYPEPAMELRLKQRGHEFDGGGLS